ncbi:MAG: ankyrin repeat domain-containing protein [Thermoanaerobaculales bacterium]
MNRSFVAVMSILVLIAASAQAARPKALGTFTTGGGTIQIHAAVATRYTVQDQPSKHYLVILMSDVPVAEADRTPSRLAELASAGGLHALRLVWKEGFDSLSVTPYDQRVPGSGQAVSDAAKIDLERYDDTRLEAQVSSRMVGQDWHFNVRLAGPVADGGIAPEEPDAAPLDLGKPGAEGASAGAGQDPARAAKFELGRLGYEFTQDSFFAAVHDHSLDAVKLFLKAGMEVNRPASNGDHVLLLAAGWCSGDNGEQMAPIIRELIAAHADVNVRNDIDSTPLLEAVSGCPVSVIEALLTAGANVNARAKGGATPLLMAEALGHEDIAAVLRRVGGHK